MKILVTMLLTLIFVLTGCDKSKETSPSRSPESTAQKEMPLPVKKTPLSLKAGMSESEFIAKVGAPNGTVMMGEKKILSYDGVMITVVDGVVVEIPPAFEAQVEEARSDSAEVQKICDAYREKGMIQYDGRWMTSAERDRMVLAAMQKRAAASRSSRQATSRASTPEIKKGHVIYKENGNEVNHSYFITKGDITVILFYSDYDSSCYSSRSTRSRVLSSKIMGAFKDERRVDVRRVDVRYYDSEKARSYNVTSIPEVRVFDNDGEMVGYPTSDFDTVVKYVEFAKNSR